MIGIPSLLPLRPLPLALCCAQRPVYVVMPESATPEAVATARSRKCFAIERSAALPSSSKAEGVLSRGLLTYVTVTAVVVPDGCVPPDQVRGSVGGAGELLPVPLTGPSDAHSTRAASDGDHCYDHAALEHALSRMLA
jgi:hypothetical protein